jgi:hypothetical protein
MRYFTYHHSSDDAPFDLVFIDGNHDYEYVLFDLSMCAKNVPPDGIIVLDNAALPGVFFAARDFLASHRNWRVAGNPIERYDEDHPFETGGGSWGLGGGDSMVLTRSDLTFVDERPTSFKFWRTQEQGRIAGVGLSIDPSTSAGSLSVQVALTSCFLAQAEVIARQPFVAAGRASVRVEPGGGPIEVKFNPVLEVDTVDATVVFADVDLIWRADEEAPDAGPLRFSGSPRLLSW